MSELATGRPEYQAIINTAVDGIIVIDEHGTIQSFNPAAERIFGYSPNEVIGRNVRDLMPQPHASKHDGYLENYRRTGAAKIIGVGREVIGARKDRTLVPLDLSIAEWVAKGRRYFTGIVRDITDRKQAEEAARLARQELEALNRDLERLNRELEYRVRTEVAQREAAQTRAAQAERMQALGQLAGGIAHDFNNVLQVISSSADMLQRRPNLGDAVLRLAGTIASAAERGASVTERLLAFARRSNLHAEPLDVARVLNELARLLAQTLGGTATLRIEVEATLPRLMADKGQLEAVLINLATNARDAMPSGGMITLSASKLAVGTAESAANGLLPGRYVVIAVRDNGIGMDEATVVRATEPFFTTKSPDKGTGLGLSMAKGFAEQSGGMLQIESRLAHGTTVSIYLPEAEMAFPEQTDHRDKAAHPRILLVGDDFLVRETLEVQLDDAGYRVISAPDGSEAMAKFATEGADLLLTDLSMPGMDGLALIRKIRERDPDMPAILITGYATEHAQLGQRTPFRLLRKPVSPARLYEEVENCLGERRR